MKGWGAVAGGRGLPLALVATAGPRTLNSTTAPRPALQACNTARPPSDCLCVLRPRSPGPPLSHHPGMSLAVAGMIAYGYLSSRMAQTKAAAVPPPAATLTEATSQEEGADAKLLTKQKADA